MFFKLVKKKTKRNETDAFDMLRSNANLSWQNWVKNEVIRL